MSSEKRPWYSWYPKDFTADEKVKCLPPLAELVYRRALDLMWQSNDIRIPNAMPLLYESLGKGIESHEFASAWERIQYPEFELFRYSDDKKWVFSSRLRQEYDKIVINSEKRKNAGKAGACARWSTDKNKEEKQTHSKRIANGWQTNGNTDTDTDTDNNTPLPPKGGTRKKIEYSESFELWWSIIPKEMQKGKADAYKKWQKIGKSKIVTPTTIIDAIKNQTEKSHFRGVDGKDYFPNAAKWLNEGRWDDTVIDKRVSTTTTAYKVMTEEELIGPAPN